MDLLGVLFGQGRQPQEKNIAHGLNCGLCLRPYWCFHQHVFRGSVVGDTLLNTNNGGNMGETG